MLSLMIVLAACSPATTPSPSSEPATMANAGAGSDVVATINGQPVTMAEVEAEAGAQLISARQTLHEAERSAVERVVIDRVVEAEASKRGVTPEQMFQTEVVDKAPKPTDEEVRAFYDENQARMPGPFEQVEPQIRQMLTQQKAEARAGAFIEELRTAANVEVKIKPFVLEVPRREGAHRKGSAEAPIQIIEFSDFQCPYCAKAEDSVQKVLEHYGDKVAITYRHWPLSFHGDAHLAAQAAECAGEQGKFWEYHQILFDNMQALKRQHLVEYASTAGADADAFTTCLDSGKYAEVVDKDLADGAAVGMNGTPGFYINGEFLNGAQPFEAFQAIIDRQLDDKGML